MTLSAPNLTTYVCEKDGARENFLRRLACDLQSVGVAATVGKEQGKVVFRMAQPDETDTRPLLSPGTDEEKGDRGPSHPARIEGLPGLVHSAEPIELDAVRPEIRFCATPFDYQTYETCRKLQTVPSGRRIGRQIRALVLDAGQVEGHRLMGSFGLASATYALACRDEYLGWRGSHRRCLKEWGLRRMMEVAICNAVPPYSFIAASKLIAALVFSNTVQAEFLRKYEEPLLGATTTSATGLHAPQFNRIMLTEGGLYRRIGETAGYTTAWLSQSTLVAARKLIQLPNSNDILSFSSKPLIVLRKALRLCGVPYERVLRLGNHKGVYFGCMGAGPLTALREGLCAGLEPPSLSANDIAEYWRSHIVPRRWAKASIRERFLRSHSNIYVNAGLHL